MTDLFPTRIGFDEAAAITRDVAARHRLDTERLAVSRAHDRMLAEAIVARLDLPPFDNSQMDGFALRHADLGIHDTLELAGEQFAGGPAVAWLDAGTCVRITTGAPLPPGADTVVMKEVARLDGDRVCVPTDTPHAQHVRRAGEDVRRGEAVLQAGQRLTPARAALAAALGCETVAVSRRPTVAVFTSGDELVEPGLPLGPGQIYDSNRALLTGLLRADGLEPTAWPRLPDDPRQVEVAVRDAACAFDLVITCGAVSAGEHDHIPGVLQRFGTVHFWKVRMRPGMPVLLASVDQARVLALPGNPVSVLATYLTLGRTLIDGLQGATDPRPAWRARLEAAIDKTHDRREFVRGRWDVDADGGLRVAPDPATASNRLRAAAANNALIVVGDGVRRLDAGAVVDVLPY